MAFDLLNDAQRQALRLTGAALARPLPRERTLEALRDAIGSPGWSPLPRLRSLAMIEPLIRHNAIEAGIDEVKLFAGDMPPRDDFERLAINYHSRWARLRQTLEGFAKAGIREVLLLKGAALAPRYPSPALRPMSDVDLCLRPDDVAAARDVLADQGWQAGDRTWIHRSGHQMDTVAATSRAALVIWDRATQIKNPLLEGADIQLLAPDDADHLYFLAGHGARHAGARLWLDLSDFDLLLDGGDREDLADEAFRRWKDSPGLAELSALLTIYNEWGYPDRCVDDGRERLEAGAGERRDYLVGALPALALDPISAMQAAALRSIFRPRWRGIAYALARLLRIRRAPPRSPVVVEPDQLPDRFFARQAAKVRLVVRLTRERRLNHYRRMASDLDNIARAQRVFDAVDPLPPVG